MRRPNYLKEKLAAGANTVGCLISLRGADSAEILAHMGFDFLLIDQEHGLGAFADAVDQMRALAGTPVSSLVRVPLSDPARIQRILDAGAECILFPSVETREQAAAAVQACFFPPTGRRGLGPGTRASRYGLDAESAAQLHDKLLVAVAIESRRGIENIEQIAAVPGIEAIFIGPRDLSALIGMNDFQAPELLRLIGEAERRILATGKYLGSSLYPGLTLADMYVKGYRLVVAGGDIGFLTQAARAALAG